MYASDVGKDIETNKNGETLYSHLTKTWADIVETSSFTFPACLKEMNMNKPKVFEYSNLKYQVRLNIKDQLPISIPQQNL